MEIEKHIKNLEEYCEDDDLFEKDGDFKEFCDNHIADIKAVIQELKNTQSDLYEANNRINDLLDTIKLKEEQIEYIENEYGRTIEQKDKIIDEMAKYIDDSQMECNKYYKDKEDVIKTFEERCKNAKD